MRLHSKSAASDAFIPRFKFFIFFFFLGNPFKVLVLNPDYYLNEHLPAMPENLLMNVIRAMKGTDGGTYTVRYCRNMHPFIITDCGHPMEKVICAADGCGEEVGSTSHGQSNTGLRQLEIPKGYAACFTKIMIRLLIHLSLLIRDTAIPEGCAQLQKLLKKTESAEVTEFLRRQATGYFRLLGKITQLNEDILSIALHQLLYDLPQAFNSWYPKGLIQADITSTYEFEMKFNTKFGGFFEQIRKFNELKDRSKIVMEEKLELKTILSEIEETKAVDNSYRSQYIPHLFLTVHKVSFDDLAQRFITEPSLKTKHPLLYHVMCSKKEVWSVKYLPAIGLFTKAVYSRFSRQITSQQYQQTTIAQVLDEWKEKGCDSEVEAWRGLEACWNTLANERVRHECSSFVIPKLHNEHEISLDLVTAQDTENGLLIVKIIQLLEDAQNTFLERIAKFKEHADHEEKFIEQNTENQRQDIREKSKSLLDVHESDVIGLDKKQVTEIIYQWSLPSLKYGAIQELRNNVLDLSAIENEIYYRFAFLSSLKSQNEKQRAFETLNEVIVFVSQNVKSIDLLSKKKKRGTFFFTGKSLVDLLEQMSFDEKNCKLFAMKVEEPQENILLCRHMCNLWRLLNNAMQLETFTGTTETKLDEMVERTALATIKDILETWREIAQSQGQQTRDLNKAEPFSNWLMFYENELDFFPKDSLTWNYCASGYAYVHKLFQRSQNPKMFQTIFFNYFTFDMLQFSSKKSTFEKHKSNYSRQYLSAVFLYKKKRYFTCFTLRNKKSINNFIPWHKQMKDSILIDENDI
ncbi:hypothetical protein RFI_30796 [Reticulomyxa filosa]|uniref:RZ-type domain-containing protein n=1 Tax=Reticulomyxa filosa TaxID=46433 RepID=X6LXB7_RETFI|nr:hypothetical protein RFI_30796 [Reticulomyxa filosa]|eukprot:ETO06593.1 hypothetical protein RFI_30796 [Reticulomyxa filosa]